MQVKTLTNELVTFFFLHSTVRIEGGSQLARKYKVRDFFVCGRTVKPYNGATLYGATRFWSIIFLSAWMCLHHDRYPWRACLFVFRLMPYLLELFYWPGGVFAIPKPFRTLFFWGDLGREQYQSLYYGVNSDGINRSVHCVHYILEQKKSHENSTIVEIRTHDTWARRRAWVWCLTHRANWSDANGRCIFLFIP